ncbi:MAG: hypothetical protein BM556_01090 [Bacteriovorax sp. MedPE-SWde]|nr:MAG: hypothetical protein BM556_01090 [Bacteriovorax sp. MedPE-SWde]
MKIVVSCDAIVDRDYYLEAVEAVLDMVGDNCDLYTIVHAQNSVVGPVEMRQIKSTFLSNFTKSWDTLIKNSYLIPSASKNLFIPCSVDLIINISRGFSHGIKKCDETKMLSFIVEDINKKPRKKSFKEFVFSTLVKSFQKKGLRQADELWTSRLDLIPASFHEKAKLVRPPVKLGDYKILPDALFQRDYILVNSEPLDLEKAKVIIDSLESSKIKFKFIGKDDHLEELKTAHEQHFYGNRCGGEMAPLISGCLYLIDLEESDLPVWSLKTMASARPVFSPGNSFVEFGEGFYEAPSSIFNEIQKLEEFDKNSVRGRAVAFEELRFKHILNKVLTDIKKELQTEAPCDNSEGCC